MVSSTRVEPEPTEPEQDEPARPAAGPSSNRSFWIGLGLIAVAAALWRFGYTIWTRDVGLLSDGIHYSQGARYLADGRGYINPLGVMMSGVEIQDGVHPPGWTTLLAVSALLGKESNLDFRLVAAGVGTLTVIITGLAARAAFNNRTGLIAAGLAAAYANIWLYEHELVSEPLALLGVAATLWCTYRFRDKPNVGWAIGMGAVVALSALTRAELILMAPLIVLPTALLARDSTWARRIGLLAVSAAAALAFIGPWFAYNTTRFTEPVPLSAGMGGAMSAGNCATTFDPSSEWFAYYHFGCAIYSGKVSEEPSEADVQRRENTMRYISEHKKEFLVAATARVGRAFSFYAPFQQIAFEAERGTPPWVIRFGLFSWWVLLPFAVYGYLVARKRQIPVYPFVGLLFIVVLAVFLTIGAVRYRAPIEIPLVMLAGFGIDTLWRRISERRTKTTGDAMGALA